MRFANTIVAVLLLASAGSGCRMCCSPYDYSNPVCPEPCGLCCSNARSGSAFTGYGEGPMPMSHGEVIYDEGVYDGEEMHPTAPSRMPAGGVRSGTPAQSTMGEPILAPIPDSRTNQTMYRQQPAAAMPAVRAERIVRQGPTVTRTAGQQVQSRYHR